MNTAAEREDRVNVVVTGGNGCLGKSLVKCLLENGGYNVHSLDLWIPEEEHRNPDVYSYIQTDITNLDDLILAFRGVGAVFHAAGILPTVKSRAKDFSLVNVKGTESVIDACKECGVRRLIYTSSISVVLSKDPSRVLNGADESLPYPERPLNAYTSTKMEAEKLVRSANGKNGLLTCVMRPASLCSVDHMLFRQSLSAQSFSIGEGSLKISLVPIAAATRAHLLAEKKLMEEGAESVVAGKAYNLCVEDKIALRDFLGLGANEKGTTVWGYPPPKSIPMWIVILIAYLNRFVYILTGTVLFGDIVSPMNLSFHDKDQTFTGALAHKELGWEELPPWQEIVRELVKEYREDIEKKKEK